MQKHDAPAVAAQTARHASIDPTTTDPWCLVDATHERTNAAHMESLFALANGALGVRGGLEEDHSPTQGSFLAGAWERTPIAYHERFTGFARTSDTRVPVADATSITLRLGDKPVRLDEGTWLAFERRLNMRTGCYRRTLRWRSPEGATLEIIAERLVALSEPGLFAIRYAVHSVDYSGPMTLASSIDTSRGAVEQGDDPRIGSHLDGGMRLHEMHVDEQQAWISQHTTQSAIRVTCGQRHRLLTNGLRFRDAVRGSQAVTQVFCRRIDAG